MASNIVDFTHTKSQYITRNDWSIHYTHLLDDLIDHDKQIPNCKHETLT